MRRLLPAITLLVLVAGPPAFGDFQLDNIEKKDLKYFIGELSAVLSPSAVSGASSRGAIFGFELGVVGGVVATPNVKKLVREQDPSSDISQMPSGGVLVAFSIPLGLSIEGVFLPTLKSEEAKLSGHSLGLKWTLTDSILSWPFDLALKYSLTNSQLDFNQDLAGPPATSGNVKLNTKISTYLLLLGKQLILIEPYISIGAAHAEGDLNISGTLNFLYTGTKKARAKIDSAIFLAGINLDLLFLNLGAEYSQVFGVSRTMAKISLGF